MVRKRVWRIIGALECYKIFSIIEDQLNGMKMKFAMLLMLLSVTTFTVQAQKVSKLTITDNLSTTGRFTLGKAKPASPKDHFYLLSEKGTQVLFYAELTSTDSSSLINRTLKFTAYKDVHGKDEWVDDRVIDVKTDATYLMTAFNFFTIGSFKILITPEETNEILAQGIFTITK